MIDYEKESVVVITIDTDWAPLECIEYTLEILEKYKIPATFFLTDDVPPDLFSDFDIGIHPNFTESAQDEDNIRRVIDKCLNQFPTATGYRPHAMVNSTRHLMIIKEHFPQLKYTSTYNMPFVPKIKPFQLESMLPELPVFWMDNLYLEMGNNFDSDYLNSKLKQPGLKVFDFHPYHLFINSQSVEHFQSSKKYYHDADKLIACRRDGSGDRNFFKFLLSEINNHNIKTMSASQVAEDFGKAK